MCFYNTMKILVTGVAGFVGFHLANKLASEDIDVFGIDNLNDYYDIKLKENRIKNLSRKVRFTVCDLADSVALRDLFSSNDFDFVVNLAAQAGVRYSITNPHAYIESNITGFLNLLQLLKDRQHTKLIYASSSSVYGNRSDTPFMESDSTSRPISLYASTKKSNELMAHVYTNMYNIQAIGLRFFTVYGPWGRPDMAYYSFTDKIIKGETIKLFNHGKMERDFTYIDDITESIARLIQNYPNKQNHEIINIGNNKPVKLDVFVRTIEKHLKLKAKTELISNQPGDVKQTYACIDRLKQLTDYTPKVTIDDGIKNFVSWYRSYYS